MKNFMNDCGCNHESHKHHDHQQKKIYLTLMDNTQLECDVLNIFEAGGKNYIAVLPKDSESALLYGFEEGNEGPQLSNIETDEEYETASKAFLELNNHP
ncbi:DUF1292 domain-containing protein [Natronincola ferrireducens]|uniref:DUF1292 domain-containing protein n=1 Tax=Natronincola ferrireducens TaxID=393762 RepID=A0A1G9EC44_9FIRM|nr:DUF1292 domain-containing protein [Natronincola ferrireducens]SDK73719.1 Protein of unknown function [Natronincola ferrireducens]